MNSRKLFDILLYGGLIVAFLAPRLPALGTFSTADEPYWLSMGANFYYALGQRQFQNTVYEYQPAVTTMWIVTAALMIYFPQYRGLGQGYLEYEKGALDPFMLQHGKDPLILLRDARLLQVLLIAFLLVVLFYLLQRLLSKPIAFFSILLVSFDPFFLGQSRLLDHEAMLALFILVSVLALTIYLFQDRKLIFLILSGLAAGFAQLTKSSGIALLAPVGVLLLIQLIQERAAFGKAILNALRIFGIWLAALIVTYIVFWPGMWVAPGKMLYEVYGNAFSYAFEGARLKAIGDVESQPSLSLSLSGIGALLSDISWRTTFITWLGILFGILFPFTRRRELVRPNARWLALTLLATALAFVIMFGLAQGRNSPHYTLTSYGALNLLAGMGWYYAVQWIGQRLGFLRSDWSRYAVLCAAVLVQIWSAAAFYPYYFTYRNPALYALSSDKRYPQFAYGEGLELAAQYLAKLPRAEESTALVYYARGCFSYFYPGQTTRFKPYYVDADHVQDLLDSLHEADYLVLYNAVQGKLEKYDRLISALADVKPIKEIWLNGYKYATVYRVADFSPAVFEALSK